MRTAQVQRQGKYRGHTHFHVREGCEEKKPEKVWSFAKLGGGRVSDGSKMPNFYFGKVFFQLACRGILVKLVICVLPGHWKTKILNLKKYLSLVCFLCDPITSNEEKMLGHLV